jgi:hypothetical protein
MQDLGIMPIHFQFTMWATKKNVPVHRRAPTSTRSRSSSSRGQVRCQSIACRDDETAAAAPSGAAHRAPLIVARLPRRSACRVRRCAPLHPALSAATDARRSDA